MYIVMIGLTCDDIAVTIHGLCITQYRSVRQWGRSPLPSLEANQATTNFYVSRVINCGLAVFIIHCYFVRATYRGFDTHPAAYFVNCLRYMNRFRLTYYNLCWNLCYIRQTFVYTKFQIWKWQIFKICNMQDSVMGSVLCL